MHGEVTPAVSQNRRHTGRVIGMFKAKSATTRKEGWTLSGKSSKEDLGAPRFPSDGRSGCNSYAIRVSNRNAANA